MFYFVDILGASNEEVMDGKCYMANLTSWLLLAKEEVEVGKLGIAISKTGKNYLLFNFMG